MAASAATAATPKTSSGASATVGVSNSSLGSILVNSTGRTLYLFKADVGMQSACTGACATTWPPLLATGKPTAGAGLTASKLATITRSDGTRQITYNGHPLYLFVKDQKPGDVKRPGRDCVRRRLVRTLSVRKPDLRHGSQLHQRRKLRRRRCPGY